MKDTLLAYLQIIPAASAEMMSSDLGLSPREVQDALHKMDDAGDVILRNGWCRISAAAKRRLGDMP